MRFVIAKQSDGQFYFSIKSNSDTLAHSEGYTRKENAKAAIDSIKRNAASADVIDIS